MRTATSNLAIRAIAGLAMIGWLLVVFSRPAVAQDSPKLSFDVEDWREAGRDDKNGIRFRSCTIQIGKDGILTGTIFRIEEATRLQSPVKNIELRLVQDGEALEMTTPNQDDGEFQFGPVEPGIYSLIGQGADGLVAYSFHVESAEKVDENADGEGKADPKPVDPPAEEENSGPKLRLINSCAMEPGDMPMAIELIQAFLGVATGAQGEEPDLEGDKKDEGEMEQAPKDADAALGDNAVPTVPPAISRRAGRFKFHHVADEVQTTALSWHAVSLQEDGSLIGRVRILVASDDEEKTLQTRPPDDMRVFLIQDGRVVAKAPCSPKGIFVMPDLPVGLYSFVSVGLDGFAAMTVEVLPAEKKPDEEREKGGIRSASLRRVGFLQPIDKLPNFDTAAVPPGDSSQLQTSVILSAPKGEIADAGSLFSGLTGAQSGNTQPGHSASSSPGAGIGGPSGVGTAGGGGFGGGAAGGGGNGGGGNNVGVPEIDPASSGVGLSVLIAMLFLLVDLRRPREAASN